MEQQWVAPRTGVYTTYPIIQVSHTFPTEFIIAWRSFAYGRSGREQRQQTTTNTLLNIGKMINTVVFCYAYSVNIQIEEENI